MGILEMPAQFVRALKLPQGFEVCELGDQWVTYLSPHVLAEEFFRSLGCGRYVSIDGNGRGTVLADLNRPLTMKLGQFDLVTDYGTGEHVFDQARLWRTVHELTKPHGYIAFDRPVQGYEGHGFYNTHECLFHDIAAANDYEVIQLARTPTSRGELIRGVFRKGNGAKFLSPQQGRYRKRLRI